MLIKEVHQLQILEGLFYEFHIYRVISKAGQPIQIKENLEIGPIIGRDDALSQVKNGKDVYTARSSDAKKIAAKLYQGNPEWEPAHEPTFFPHFHPGNQHPLDHFASPGRPHARNGPGHVFFGSRGEYYSPPKQPKIPRMTRDLHLLRNLGDLDV
jgi:hypothetical protein